MPPSPCASGAFPTFFWDIRATTAEEDRTPWESCDGLDLDQLFSVSEHGHSEERARSLIIFEVAVDNLPRRKKCSCRPLATGTPV
jgi:hypothetical protein